MGVGDHMSPLSSEHSRRLKCDLEIDWAQLEACATGLGFEWGNTTRFYPIEG
jgi:hypothetical protein